MKRGLSTGLLVVAVLAAGPVAHATFTNPSTASSTFSTATLAAPSGLTATSQCGLLQYEIKLDWTSTSSTWADGYEVQSATSSAGPYTVVPLPVGADPLATSRVVGSLAASTTYWFQVTATRGGWRSAAVSVSATTSALCLL